jgi:very-short-patch-repair endonuclease
MALQPVKKSGPYQKPRSKTVRKKKKVTVAPKRRTTTTTKRKTHPEYGTSKLEKRFEDTFLKKLGVKYQRQFYAADIKRYYDFFIPEERVLIEIDGDYYHSYGLVYEEMNPMQKRNHRVDKLKDEWAAMHSIPLLRIWEHDINNNPVKVMEMLKEMLDISSEKNEIIKNKKKRH